MPTLVLTGFQGNLLMPNELLLCRLIVQLLLPEVYTVRQLLSALSIHGLHPPENTHGWQTRSPHRNFRSGSRIR